MNLAIANVQKEERSFHAREGLILKEETRMFYTLRPSSLTMITCAS